MALKDVKNHLSKVVDRLERGHERIGASTGSRSNTARMSTAHGEHRAPLGVRGGAPASLDPDCDPEEPGQLEPDATVASMSISSSACLTKPSGPCRPGARPPPCARSSRRTRREDRISCRISAMTGRSAIGTGSSSPTVIRRPPSSPSTPRRHRRDVPLSSAMNNRCPPHLQPALASLRWLSGGGDGTVGAWIRRRTLRRRVLETTTVIEPQTTGTAPPRHKTGCLRPETKGRRRVRIVPRPVSGRKIALPQRQPLTGQLPNVIGRAAQAIGGMHSMTEEPLRLIGTSRRGNERRRSSTG